MATTRRIELKTAIPGPRSREVLDRLAASVASPLAITFPIVGRRGPRRDDHRRRREHLHRLRRRRRLPERRPLASARRRRRPGAARAASRTPTSRSSRTRSTRRSPSACSRWRRFSGPAKAAFFNAGTEAVENAVKFARAYTGRQAVIGFEGAFHGRTYLSLALTSKTHPYKAGLGPFAPEVYRVPVPERVPRPDGRRGARGAPPGLLDARRGRGRRRDRLRAGPGRGRLHPGDAASSCEGLREICDEHGIVFVCDEVQSGFARTGRFFAIEHFGRRARPDHGRQVDRDGHPALGRARQGRDHGCARARAVSAAPTSATRSPRRPRSPCST